jgi:hypothetical protein
MKKTISLLATFLMIVSAGAQVAVLPAGGDASGSGGSVSYSIGQVVFTLANGSAGSVAQGVQQPYEISVATGTPDIPGINLSLSVYPNPATDNLTLSIENLGNADLIYQLFDTNGKIIEIGNIKDSKTNINMRSLRQAIYYVKVSNKKAGAGTLKTFKVIKH